MAQSLNKYASRVAHLIGQPDNHSLKERIKDMIKNYFAKYIIQSIDKNGIHDYYKIILEVVLTPVESSKVIAPISKRETYTEFTSTKIPRALNLKSDAPFTRVSLVNSPLQFSYRTIGDYRISSTLSPTRATNIYRYNNSIITIKRKFNHLDVVNTNLIEKIEVEGLWENPEEVIGFYSLDDNQDIELPFPDELLNFVIADLLKVEFNIVPADTEIEKK